MAFESLTDRLAGVFKKLKGHGKLNEADIKAAMREAAEHGSLEVPLHLRNAPTKLMKQLGYGEEYRYAHDEPDAYAAGEDYFPEQLEPRQYYQPVPRGLELKIGEKLRHLAELDRTSPRQRRKP